MWERIGFLVIKKIWVWRRRILNFLDRILFYLFREVSKDRIHWKNQIASWKKCLGFKKTYRNKLEKKIYPMAKSYVEENYVSRHTQGKKYICSKAKVTILKINTSAVFRPHLTPLCLLTKGLATFWRSLLKQDQS